MRKLTDICTVCSSSFHKKYSLTLQFTCLLYLRYIFSFKNNLKCKITTLIWTILRYLTLHLIKYLTTLHKCFVVTNKNGFYCFIFSKLLGIFIESKVIVKYWMLSFQRKNTFWGLLKQKMSVFKNMPNLKEYWTVFEFAKTYILGQIGCTYKLFWTFFKNPNFFQKSPPFFSKCCSLYL